MDSNQRETAPKINDRRKKKPNGVDNAFVPYPQSDNLQQQSDDSGLSVRIILAVDIHCNRCNKRFLIGVSRIGESTTCPGCHTKLVFSFEFFEFLLEDAEKKQGNPPSTPRHNKASVSNENRRPLQLSLYPNTIEALNWLGERAENSGRAYLNRSFLYEWLLYRYPPFLEALITLGVDKE